MISELFFTLVVAANPANPSGFAITLVNVNVKPQTESAAEASWS